MDESRKRKQVTFLPVRDWRPAGEMHGPHLETMENLIPEFGANRALQLPVAETSLTHGSPYSSWLEGAINGAHSHVYPYPDAPQVMDTTYIENLDDTVALSAKGQAYYSALGAFSTARLDWLRIDSASYDSYATFAYWSQTDAEEFGAQFYFDRDAASAPADGAWYLYYAVRVRGMTSWFTEESQDIAWQIDAVVDSLAPSVTYISQTAETGSGNTGYGAGGEEWLTGTLQDTETSVIDPPERAELKLSFTGTVPDIPFINWGAIDPSIDTDDELGLDPLGEFSDDGWEIQLGAASNVAEALRRLTTFSIESDEVPPNGSGPTLIVPIIQNAQDVDFFEEFQNDPALSENSSNDPELELDTPHPWSLETVFVANQPNMSLRIQLVAGTTVVYDHTESDVTANATNSLSEDLTSTMEALDPTTLRKGMLLKLTPLRGADTMTSASASVVYPSSGSLAAAFDGDDSNEVTIESGTDYSGSWTLTPSTFPEESRVLRFHFQIGSIGSIYNKMIDVFASQASMPEVLVASEVVIEVADEGVDQFIELPKSVVAEIDPSEALVFRIRQSNSGQSFTLEDGYLEVPDRATISVERCSGFVGSSLNPDVLRTPRLDVATLNLVIPRPDSGDTPSLSDKEDIYLANQDTIWVIPGESGIPAEVVDGTAYPSGYGTPGDICEWNFCSFGGELVVATNRSDPVQVRQSNTGDFGDLITAPSSNPPLARFAVPFRNRLLLACLGGAGGWRSDQFIVSVSDDITDFESAGSDSQVLYEGTPGEITGAFGGSYAILFKRNSMYLVDFIGGAAIFRVEVISHTVGTPSNRSIVEANGVLYFWDGSNFRSWEGPGTLPLVIGRDEVSRFMTYGSAAHGNGRLALDPVPAQRLVEGLRMQGAYDPHSGLVVWGYQSRSAEPLRINQMIFFNPRENRWGFADLNYGSSLLDDAFPSALQVDIPEGDFSTLFRRMNFQRLAGRSLRGVSFVRNRDPDDDDDLDDWNLCRLAGTTTYPATVVTKVQQVVENENVVIESIRPVFTSDPGDAWPEALIKIEMSNDPRMEVGVDTVTVRSVQASELGEYPVSLGGRWVRITMSFAPSRLEFLEGFAGFYVHYRLGARQ